MVVNRTTGIGRIDADGAQIGADIDISGLTGDVSPQSYVVIGTHVRGDPGWFKGIIDEVRLYDVALTPQQSREIDLGIR